MTVCNASILTPDERTALFRDTSEAQGLPGRVYYDPAIYEAERTTIFTKYWVGAAFASDVPRPGDVIPINLAGRELIVVRGNDGKVRCFYNLCRHRGMKLVTQPGTMRDIRCRYHSWVFGLDGSLVGTPAICGIGKNTAPDIDRDELGLMEVRTESWFDLIFVNLDGQAEPFEDYIRPVRERLEPYFDTSLVKASGETLIQRYPVNWKIVLEGGIEDYHLPFVHRSLKHSPLYQAELGGETYAGFSSTARPIETISKRFLEGEEKDTVKTFPIFPAMEERGEGHGVTLFIFPSVVVTCDVNLMKANISLPDGPEATDTRIRAHFIGDAANLPEYATAREKFFGFWTEILGEDDEIWRELQSMARTREESGVATRFSPHWEQALHAFQKYWASRIDG